MNEGMYKATDIRRDGLTKISALKKRETYLRSQHTYAFTLKIGEWNARWRGQVSPIVFNSKGAAIAYLKTCDKAGKLRS